MALLLAIFWVYTPALRSDFVRFDDYLYVADNPRTQAGVSVAGARWAFTDDRAQATQGQRDSTGQRFQ